MPLAIPGFAAVYNGREGWFTVAGDLFIFLQKLPKVDGC
jgi:hypothetical protein